MALRQKAIEASPRWSSDDDVPEVLVDAEVNERLHDLQHRLEAQKLSLAEYFQATGTSPDDLLTAVRVDAHGAVKADLALRALVEAEELTLERRRARCRGGDHGRAHGHHRSRACAGNSTRPAGRARYARSCARARRWSGCWTTWSSFDEEGNPMSRDDLRVDASKDDGRRRRRSGERANEENE